MNSIRKILAFTIALILVICSTCVLAEAEEWICPECSMPNMRNFCTQCGTEKPKEIVCSNCGETYPSDTNAVFCGNCGVKLGQAEAVSVKYEGDGFATPEEALTCYMEDRKSVV